MKKFIGTFYRIISLTPISSQAGRGARDEMARAADARAADPRLGDAAGDGGPEKPGQSDEDFFVDYAMEEEAILQEAALLAEKPEFNFLGITEHNARQFEYLFGDLAASLPDLNHLYSCRSSQQLLVVNMEKIWLANAETATVTQEMRRKDVAQVNILPHSVSVVGSPRDPHKHSEMIILDRNKFAAVAEYFSLYWVNLVISPLARQL